MCPSLTPRVYRYLLIDDATNKAAVVDPFDYGKITAAAEKENVKIGEQLITTHQYVAALLSDGVYLRVSW